MKKIILISLTYFFCMLISCSSSISDPIIDGEWGDCNGWSPIQISFKGDVLLIHTKNRDITLQKKAPDLYTSVDGLIVLTFDNRKVKKQLEFINSYKKTGGFLDSTIENMKKELNPNEKRWYLSGVFPDTIELCKKSEVS